MNLRNFWVISLLFFSGSSMAAKIIYGYIEQATLVDKGMHLSAKLDTGAKSASLSAVNIRKIVRGGKPYLKFTVPNKGEEVEFTSEYLGKVQIKARADENSSSENQASVSIKRPVVLMSIQIGDKIRQIPVNLINRKHFNHPLLLGRDAIIAFDGLIDPSHAFLLKPEKLKKDEVK